MGRARWFAACPGEAEQSAGEAAAGVRECVRWSRSDEGKKSFRFTLFFCLRFEVKVMLELTQEAAV